MEKIRFFLITVAILGAMVDPFRLSAQSTAQLHAGYEKYWQEDLSYLKKIGNEKDAHQAALLVNAMKEDMLPKLRQQLVLTDEWKKTHSTQEVKVEEEWSAKNPLQSQVASSQMDLMIRSSKEGGELAEAFKGYMKAMTLVSKKGKM